MSRILLTVCALIAFWAPAASALSPHVKCRADKNKEAGKYALCRQKAEEKRLKTGGAPDYTKCDARLFGKWEKIETKAAGSCSDAVTDNAIQGFVTAHSDGVAAALGGGSLPDCPGDLAVCNSELNVCNSELNDCQNPTCGNNQSELGEQCDGTDLNGATCTSLGHELGALACNGSCAFDASACFRCADVGGVLVGGACWFLGGDNESCDTVCSANGLLYDNATQFYAGSGGTNSQCQDVLVALGGTAPFGATLSCADGWGCVFHTISGDHHRCQSIQTNAAAATPGFSRACACE